MNNLTRDIEKSTRRVYRLFFGSRLYLRREEAAAMDDDLVGVDLRMLYHGDKKLSFYVDRRTIESLREKLGDPRGSGGENVDHDIIGEMANIIAGNAICGEGGDAQIFPPEKTPPVINVRAQHMLNFSSKMGRLCIAIEEM